jgi:hypothetical protein
MRMSAGSTFCATFAIAAAATLAPAPALADTAIPLARVARDLGYHYAYLPLENEVSLTRAGAVILVRPGDGFFTVNDRREPVYGTVPYYRGNDVVVSRAFESEIKPFARYFRTAAAPAPEVVEAPDAGTVDRVAANYLPSASTVDVAGRATPGTHVSVILRVVLSQDLPVITLDGADIVADQNGAFRARLNTAPNHFALARFYVEAAAPGNRAPAIAKVTDLGLDPAQHTKADDSLTK